jgi:hypothetical protein
MRCVPRLVSCQHLPKEHVDDSVIEPEDEEGQREGRLSDGCNRVHARHGCQSLRDDAPKDVILYVAGQLTVSGGTNAIVEYIGPVTELEELLVPKTGHHCADVSEGELRNESRRSGLRCRIL